MVLAIIGSRGFKDYKKLCDVLDPQKDKIDKVVSGGASGADKLGEKWANKNNIETEIFLPNWQRHGKKAGFIRNEEIVEASTHVIAFWDGESKGTKHSMGLALKTGKKLKTVIFENVIDKDIEDFGEFGE